MRPGVEGGEDFVELPSEPSAPAEIDDGKKNLSRPQSPAVMSTTENFPLPRRPAITKGSPSRARTPEGGSMDFEESRGTRVSSIIMQAAAAAEQEAAARATAQSAAAIAAQARKMRDRGRSRRAQSADSEYDLEHGHMETTGLPIAQVVGQDTDYVETDKASPTARDLRGQKLFVNDGKAYNLPPPPAFALLDIKQRGRFQGPKGYRLCLWLVLFTVAAIIAMGIVTLLAFLTLQPKSPSYDLKEIRVQWWTSWKDSKGYVSQDKEKNGTAVVTVYLYASAILSVEASNPNRKVGIHYDNTTIELSYLGHSLGFASIPAFYQPPDNKTVVEGEWRCDQCAVPLVGHYMEADQSVGEIPLSIKMFVEARADVGGYTSPAVRFQDTYDVTVRPPSTPAAS